MRWESTLDLLAISHDHHGKGSVAGISDTIVGPVSLGSTKEMDRRYSQWDETNHTAPTEADTAQVEKGVVELVSSALNSSEDFGIVLRHPRWNGLATLACFLAKGTAEA